MSDETTEVAEETFTPAPLDSIVNNEPETETQQVEEPVAAKEADGPADEVVETKGEQGEIEDEPPASNDEVNEKGEVPLAALKDERQKRQTLQAENDQLREQLKGDPTPRPSVFEDEAAFNQNIDATIDNKVTETKLRMSYTMASKEHGKEKLDGAWETFNDLRAKYPYLNQDFGASDHPFDFVMDKVTEFAKLDSLENGTVDKEIESRVDAKVKEILAGMEKDANADANVPDSMAGEATSGGLQSSSWNGPAPLDSFVGPPQ